ncbi:E3 ubiquitin-protein ligase RNF181-like [Bombyx mandarina]|uniref:RING-type E3 ubiquitin transferase n=1 Tax=Bombyx mandarina TaxID=7092 RepID=A0A6J2JKR0_BOMMA|nr:E3 ubiquitin-protein ligase RNF181-like [Bombyx mandarina]
MAGYFEEMGWRELGDGEQPNHLLHFARFLIDSGLDRSGAAEWPSLPPPASKEAVKKLQDVIIENQKKGCPICLKNLEAGEKVKKMPCNHIFHPRCILTWLDKTNSCPFCRHEMPTDDENYEAYKKAKKRAEQSQNDLDALHNSMFS